MFLCICNHITDNPCSSPTPIERAATKHKQQIQHSQGYGFQFSDFRSFIGTFLLTYDHPSFYFVGNSFLFLLQFVYLLQQQMSNLHVMQVTDQDGHDKVCCVIVLFEAYILFSTTSIKCTVACRFANE